LWVCVIARHPDPRERERARELALKEEELQMTRKLKEAELVLQKQQIKNKQELENTLAMKTKRFSDVLKGALIKMSSDPVEVASFSDKLMICIESLRFPKTRGTLVKPYINDKA